MSKVREILVIILFATFNIAISFFLTNLFGVTNNVVFRTYSAVSQEITWEVIIFFVLSFVEALIYEFYKKKN